MGITAELVTERCFLQIYVESILALQARAKLAQPADSTWDGILPLAIMTSDDTSAALRGTVRGTVRRKLGSR